MTIILLLLFFFDLKKAFETINHDILIVKLKGMGFRGNCIPLIQNYLTNGIQYCKANG